MNFLASPKWVGITALLGIVLAFLPFLFSSFTQRNVTLELLSFGTRAIRLSPDEAKDLLAPNRQYGTLFETRATLLNRGTKSLTENDYLKPITVRAEPTVEIFSVTSFVEGHSEERTVWSVQDSRVSQMPIMFLNPGEAISISIIGGVLGQHRFSESELSDFTKWSGRFKEISAPEAALAYLTLEGNFLFWQTPIALSYQPGLMFFFYILLAIIIYSTLCLVSIILGYASRPLLFTLLNLFFVIMAFGTADSILPSSLPSALSGRGQWINFIMPLAVLCCITFLYLFRNRAINENQN